MEHAVNAKRLPLLSLLLALTLACGPGMRGNGTKVTRVHELSNFDALENTTSLDVVLHRGSEDFRVDVFLDENLQDAVQLEIADGALRIDTSTSWLDYDGEGRVDVYLPRVRRVELTGSGDLRAEGSQAPEALVIESSGSGDLELCGGMLSLDVKLSGSGDIGTCAGDGAAVETLALRSVGSGDFTWTGELGTAEVTLVGSGAATLRGAGTRLKGTVEGSGSLDAGALPVHDAALHNSGSGLIRATVNGGVASVRIDGSGDVELSGDGTVDVVGNAGSGKLIRR